MIKKAMWIEGKEDFGEICPIFFKTVITDKEPEVVIIELTATGVYELYINGERVGDYVLAPGWTDYEHRLQYQRYDITKYFKKGENLVEICVGRGWYTSRIKGNKRTYVKTPLCIAAIEMMLNGEKTNIYTDTSWGVKESKILFSDIYDGEVYDANYEGRACQVKKKAGNKAVLIPQEGEIIKEQESFLPVSEFITPKGERVIDFGQEITGYIEYSGMAKKGDEVSLSFAEVMDKEGNFYKENYRGAKCIYKYICKDGEQTYKTHTTFYGFRYIRVDCAPENTPKEAFRAIVVHSDMKKTGTLTTSNKFVDRLFRNVEWGQRGNFVDVPTDCPQRDERYGWTGDAQVFIKTATYQYDTKKFFSKWLNDMMVAQRNDGLILAYIPDLMGDTINGELTSPAWGDAAVICPWTLYETYGDKELLAHHYPMMKKWIEYIEATTSKENLWIDPGRSYGDWLGLDAVEGSYRGATRTNFIASAYYVYDLSLILKAAIVLKSPEMELYRYKLDVSRRAFIEEFPECTTQTEYTLALRFNLTDKKEEYAQKLAQMIKDNGNCLTTGFVGTPYLLFALSENGQTDVAYDLLLQEKFPSWLFSVKQGATTIWEHWDGIKEDGSFWSKDMNSFNHYAYGSVAQWVYSFAAGIIIDENGLMISPHPNKKLNDLKAEFLSRYGKVVTEWHYEGDKAIINVEIPVRCPVVINNVRKMLDAGKYKFEI